MKIIYCNTVVVGSGAAGLNAALRLCQYGEEDVVLVTEDMNLGTSRNAGSDKQTYYKLTLGGGEGDSVLEMAQTLFSGKCVDGDHALCEAALSAQGFLRLADLGVPFPRNGYGEYVGYKTDHDPRKRASSAGPYTSRKMTEVLERAVRKQHIPIYDGVQAIRVLTDSSNVCGLLCLDQPHAQDSSQRFLAFACANVVLATGGPAGMYQDSVYPLGHCGASGLAFRANASGQNLTEWQYGLASLLPRWNVSGTYMQVLPRVLSTAADGSDEQEFLFDFCEDTGKMLSLLFLKGYQWPFDVKKIKDGSSIIDVLVYLERKKGRRVWLDFRENPRREAVNFDTLSTEAGEYLKQAGACFGTPFERLQHMNAPAVNFYLDHGVDLSKEPLEIALCAQHNNGGIAVDAWWQTRVEGLFAVGEAAGTHGVCRPGGSALNAGQTGSDRAARYIAAKRSKIPVNEAAFFRALSEEIKVVEQMAENALHTHEPEDESVRAVWERTRERMSVFGAAIREQAGISRALEGVNSELEAFSSLYITSPKELPLLFRLEDVLLCQKLYLSAMLDYIEMGGKSRGSALYLDASGERAHESLGEAFSCVIEGEEESLIQEARLDGETCRFTWRKPRPIPQTEDFFENVWRTFREHENAEV